MKCYNYKEIQKYFKNLSKAIFFDLRGDTVFWHWLNRNKTIKELRKNQGLTARELAMRVKLETPRILKVDDMKLKDVPEPLKKRIIPHLNGKNIDKAPWL